MKKRKISDATAFLMIFTALCFDAIQALIGWIPIVGNIAADLFSIFIFLTFLLWFYLQGVKMVTPKRLGSMGIGGFIEMIPYVNLLPAWTLVVVYLIGTTKMTELSQKNPELLGGVVSVGSKVKDLNKTETLPNTPFIDTE